MSIDIGEMGSEIAGMLLVQGTKTAAMVNSESVIRTFFDMYSERGVDASALKEAIRTGFKDQLKKFSEDKTAQFDFDKLIESGIIPRVNQLFFKRFSIALDLPNYNISALGSEVAGLICIQGTSMSRMVGSAVLIDALFERYKDVDATALKEAIEDQFEKTFREFQDEGGFNIEKLEKSGIIASTGRSFRSHFRTELNITIPAGLGSRMTDSMHKLLRKLDNLP